MDERRLLEQQIAALHWPDFQRLVHELVKKEQPGALHLRAPDGGADTLIPAEGARKTEVIQSKHSPGAGAIKWSNWRSSAEAAVITHDPGQIRFAVSRDFSAKDEAAFRKNVVDHFPEIEIQLWTLTDIIARLEHHSDLRKRYFGRELHEDDRDSILRAIQHGGKLETGEDLIHHARSLAQFAEEHDRDFEYRTSSGNATMREPRWDELPFITMSVQNETTSVQVDAWAREGADLPPARFSFTDDEAGRQAHRHAREELAQGRDAVLRNGVHIQILKAPKLLLETTDGDTFGADEITLRAGESIAVELEFETETETVTRTFAARPVPPKEYGHVAFASIDAEVAIELDFLLEDGPSVSFTFTLKGRFREDVSANVEAARFLHAFCTHKRHAIRAEGLFPGGELEGRFLPGTETDRRLVAGRLAVYQDLSRIEDHTGVDFVLPESLGQEDMAAIRTVAKIIETGEGTATFQNASGVVEVNQIASLSKTSQQERIVRKPVVYEVLGQEVDLGVGEYEIPAIKVFDVTPLGARPDSPARVTIGPAGDDQMRFRLVASSPRAA